jgi:hypothetical protein
MFDVSMVIGIGSSREISTSKIMKITAIRKNRDQNGSRAEFFKFMFICVVLITVYFRCLLFSFVLFVRLH